MNKLNNIILMNEKKQEIELINLKNKLNEIIADIRIKKINKKKPCIDQKINNEIFLRVIK